MTIEFHCPHCDKLLKTPDDKAGVRANCPGCGEVITVPDAALEAAHADASFEAEPAASAPHGVAAGPIAEAEATPADDTKPCPMCGALVRRLATRCRHCGEPLIDRRTAGAWEPTRIHVGEILTVAWETYKTQLGILIGSFVIWGGIYMGMSILNQVVVQVLMIAMVGIGGGGPGAGGAPNALAVGATIIVVAVGLTLLLVGVLMYLEAGMCLLWLRVARGEYVQIADMFSGRRYMWRLLGLTMLMGGVFVVGYLSILVPAIAFNDPRWSLVTAVPFLLVTIVASLRLWPVFYVIVDRDAGIFDALRDSLRATSGNSLPVLVLAVVAVPLSILGVLACGVGTLFTAPLIRLFFAVAYCGMTGQLALDRDRAPVS